LMIKKQHMASFESASRRSYKIENDLYVQVSDTYLFHGFDN